jgi:transport and Golgi organization protein 2
MCTVTIVPRADGVRLVCNRDEQRSRAHALPPATRQTASGFAMYPIDPSSGGTWIGVNDSGLVVVLLNRTLPPAAARRTATLSRGVIVPAVLACGSIDAAVEAIDALDCRQFEPFTVVLSNRTRGVSFTSVSTRCTRECFDVSAPRLFTSSSLGDRLVEPPRQLLFERLIAGAADRLAGQFRFHRHHWAGARHVSVCMERDDAATVSRTTIDLVKSGIHLDYEPIAAPALLRAKTG